MLMVITVGQNGRVKEKFPVVNWPCVGDFYAWWKCNNPQIQLKSRDNLQSCDRIVWQQTSVETVVRFFNNVFYTNWNLREGHIRHQEHSSEFHRFEVSYKNDENISLPTVWSELPTEIITNGGLRLCSEHSSNYRTLTRNSRVNADDSSDVKRLQLS